MLPKCYNVGGDYWNIVMHTIVGQLDFKIITVLLFLAHILIFQIYYFPTMFLVALVTGYLFRDHFWFVYAYGHLKFI